MNLFLDTEWADPIGSELVSLALVSEDGAYQFYAERDPLPAFPTDFVRHAVYPLLQGGPAAMSDMAMTTALRAFLSAIPGAWVLADYPNDLQLLQYVLAGFDLGGDQVQRCGPVPLVNMELLVSSSPLRLAIEAWFQSNPEQCRRRHHSMVDAQALRAAWRAIREAKGQVD
ncbi:TPA: 3'-5' exoribonuclease [Stenotrophomonas maltophilia]|nr:3'-5' exoribonuclease [Stenotrophomonas maltophilia]